MDIKISAGGKTLAEITSISFGSATYTTVASVAETPDALTINLSGSTAVTITKVQSGIRLYGKVATAQSVKIGMKDQGDHFFGISEQNLFATNNPDLRGRTVPCVVMSYDMAENFAQAWSPFYFSSLGYAGYFDTFAEGTYVFGVSGATSLTHTTNTLDWYVFYGPTGDKIHQAYFTIIGAPKKVPIWACGPFIWNDDFSGSDHVLNYASNAASNKIPLTVIMVDRPYSDGFNQWSEMNFNANFANPQTWIKQTLNTDHNCKLVTWVAPCTFGAVNPPGEWNTTFYYLDLSKPASVSWYTDRLATRQHAYGVQGHKMDRADDQFPVDSAWYDGTPKQERRAKYLFRYAKVIDSALRLTWGENQFNVARAAYSRGQQYLSAVWGGDPRAPWEGLSGNVANCIRTGFMGFPMWGSDCGGYLNKSKLPSDQLLRWGAFGVFSGFMESMLDGKEPWIYTSEVIAKVKSQYDLRMELLPYVYSLANTSADIGVMQRPLAYMYPDDQVTWTNWDEYLFGPAMLVAPMYSSTTSRGVYLPAGTWINFWDYNDVRNGKSTITVSVPALEQIPVYIKRNSIFPTGRIYSGTMIQWVSDFNSTRTVVINAFPGAAGESSDFTYVDYLDNNSRKTLSVRSLAGNIIQVQSPAMTVSGTVMVRLDAQPTSVTRNGVAVTNWHYSGTTKKLEVPYPANQATALEVTLGGNPVPQYTLTTTATNGTISLNPAGGVYNSGTTVTLTAMPATGYTFSGWSGNLTGTANPATIAMNANKSVSATFTPNSTPNAIVFEAENLTRTASAVGSNVSTGDVQNGNGAYVQLSGTPAAGAWLEFTLPNIAAATYNIKMYFKANTNRGICQGSVDETNLGTACDEYRTAVAYQVMFDMGSRALTAGDHKIRFTVTGKNAASAGYTMTIDKIVLTPTTPVQTYTLNTTAANGSVTLNPAGGTYVSGTVVTLTANPAAGYAFSGWSGDLSGTANPATITMNANKTVTAAFTATPIAITFEAENLARTASSIGSNVSTGDAQNGNGAYVQLSGTSAAGAWLEFTLPNIAAATYNIKMYFKANTNRGICQGSVDETNLGTACDEYRTAVAYQVLFDMGSRALTAGDHKIRFTVTGKNTASAGYTMTIDKIVLTRQ